MAVVNCLGKGTPYNGESDNNKETYWKKEWQKEAKERLDLHTKIMEEYDIQLAAIEAKYKKSKHKSFSTALRLNKVAKKDMAIYKLSVRFMKIAIHSAFKNIGK